MIAAMAVLNVRRRADNTGHAAMVLCTSRRSAFDLRSAHRRSAPRQDLSGVFVKLLPDAFNKAVCAFYAGLLPFQESYPPEKRTS